MKKVPLFVHEVLGKQRLEELARVLYAGGEDPEAVTRTEKPYTFGKRDGLYEIRVLLPFATKGERSCSRRATNWWCRSAPSAGTLACHDPWLRCRRHERGWKARR